MKKLPFFLLVLAIIGCNNQENVNEDISKIKKESDSLRSVLKKYEEKYVYDFVALRQAPTIGNSFKKGSSYKGEITFVPMNKEDYILFGTEIRKTDNNTEIINPDTLKPAKGVYSFETKLLVETTRLYFQPLIRNNLALDHMNSFYNELSFSEEIIIE